MFRELKIKNFQSLKSANLKLGKRTVIIGPSFLGKSAVVRALNTLIRNRFSASYATKGTSSTSVELVDENGDYVRFNRGSNTTYDFSKAAEGYSKIGRDVPPDIKDFLNMDEIRFDQDLTLDFNIQKQFDSPFILGLSGFEIAKVFGKMMNLDVVMSASRLISNDILSLNKQKDKYQAQIDVALDYLQKNYSVQVKYSMLQEAIVVQEALEAEEDELQELEDLIATFTLVEYRLSILRRMDELLKEAKIDELEDPPKELEQILVNLQYAQDVLDSYAEISLDGTEFDTQDYSEHEQLIQLYIYNSNVKNQFSEVEKGLSSSVFDVDAYLEQQVLIIQGTQINAMLIECSKLMREIKLIDFSEPANIISLQGMVEEGTEINSTYASLVKESNRISAEEKLKKEEFDQFIKKNNICPIAKVPYSDHCIQAMKGEKICV